MKNIYPLWLLCSLVFSFPQLSAQSTFQKIYGGAGNETGNHIISVEDGYVIAGQTTSPTGDLDAYLLRINADGDVLWQNNYGGSQEDAFTLVTAASDGGFLAMGDTRSAGAGGKDVFLVKVTADGFVEWTKTFGNSNDEVSPTQAKIVRLDNGYFVAGYRDNGGSISSFFVRLLNDGTVVWERTLTSASNFLVGNYATGDTIYAAGAINNDGCLAKIDLNTGDLLFLRTFPQPFNDALYNVRPTQDGNLLLSDGTWSATGGTEQRQWLMKTRLDGTVLWSKTYGKAGINLRGVANNVSDGGFILVPYTSGFNEASDANLVKVDSNGIIQWAYSYGGPSDDQFLNALETSDGGIIAVGTIYDPASGENDILLVKTNANGLVTSCPPRVLTLSVEDLAAEGFEQSLSVEDFAPAVDWDVSMPSGLLSPSDYCPPFPVILDTTFALCPSQPVIIADNVYTAPAVVTDTLAGPGGVDTIITYTLLLAPQPVFSDTIFLCAGDSLVINGIVYTQPATVADTLPSTTGGCDTLATYVILLGRTPTLQQNISFCSGDTVVVNGVTYTQPDTISYSIPATIGCDTLVIVILDYAPQLSLTKTLVLCPGDSININGIYYTEPAVVTNVIPAISGCDTLVTCILDFAPQPTLTRTIAFCLGASVTIDGTVYTQPSTVSSVIPATTGCDTLATYVLEFAPQPGISRTISFCAGDSVEIDGVLYTEPGVVSSIIPASTGCDTIATYILDVKPQVAVTSTILFCPGDLVSIDGITYTQPTTVSSVIPGITGCDTLATYILDFAPQPAVTRTLTFCQGASVTIDGTVYTQPSTVSSVIPATSGCDTLATYILDFAPQPAVTRTLSFCPGASVTIDGTVYTQPGTVSSVIPATSGCDTLATYILEFAPQPAVTRTLSFCPGASVTIDGTAYTQPGTVSSVIPATSGCDTLATYILEFAPQPAVTRTLSFCPGASVTIDGTVYTQPGTVSSVIAATNGCDTLATYILEFAPQPAVTRTLAFCPGASVTIDGTVYTQPGTVSSVIAATSGCDTLATYVLEFAPQPTVTRTIEFCKGDSVLIQGVNYAQPGTINLVLPATSGCDTLATYTLRYLVPDYPTTVTIACPNDISVIADPGESAVSIAYNLPVAATDCPCPGVALSLQQGLASGNNFPTGLTSVCYEAKDSCGNSARCCFNVMVQETSPCDTKVSGCIKYELLSITQDSLLRKTYRIRTINNCASRLTYVAIQVPNGVVADLPVNNTIYTAPSGRTYSVRNPNFTPFYSLRYSSVADSIQNGESDVFKYTLPTQSVPAYIHITARVESQVSYAALLNTFFCPVGNEPGSNRLEREADHQYAQGAFSLFPNPTDGTLFADFSAWVGQKVQVRVFSTQGRLMQSTQLIAGEQTQVLDLPATLANGLYLLEVTPAQGERQTRKFTVIR